jgi:hypothetical protein
MQRAGAAVNGRNVPPASAFSRIGDEAKKGFDPAKSVRISRAPWHLLFSPHPASRTGKLLIQGQPPYMQSVLRTMRGAATHILHGAAMTTFDKREEGFEKRFAHDEELRFKATARRNKMLGYWAAEKLGITGADADAYAKAVVLADFEEAGDEDVIGKVRKDFDAKGIGVSEPEIRRQLDSFFLKAVEELKTGR